MTHVTPPLRVPLAHLELGGAVPVVVIDVPDWLDAATAPDVEGLLAQALRTRPARVAVDLTRCVLADPYGVGMLARVRLRAQEQGSELVLVGANARVRRVLELVGLADALPVLPRDQVLAG
ncbi:MAG TPA: STAS domain-containing protein [Mycobacteriales bacterium]|nr:STAS domain-containing protein [Mycobacteriales bacterium]